MKTKSLLPFANMLKPLIVGCLLALLLSGASGYAQGAFLERSYTITSEKETFVEAKRDIQEKAIFNAVEEITKEVLGEERFNKNKKILETRIVAKASRFIPFSKSSEPLFKDSKYTQTVYLKISLQDLKNILKENRLLEEIDHKLNILPLIQFENKVTEKKYRWWLKNDEGMKKASLLFEEQFQKFLLKNGVFLQRPTFFNYQSSTPLALITENWTKEDYLALGKWYNAPFVVEGSLVVQKSEKKSSQVNLIIKLNLIQVQQGKVLIDLQRLVDVPAFKEDIKLEMWVENKIIEETETLAQDLSQQLDEILQKGILNSQKIRLQFVMGPMPAKIESIKEKLKISSAIIKSIREREITSQFVVYEVDFSGTVQELQAKILSADLGLGPQGKVSLIKTSEKEMVFEVK